MSEKVELTMFKEGHKATAGSLVQLAQSRSLAYLMKPQTAPVFLDDG
jgi:hypothetical protein